MERTFAPDLQSSEPEVRIGLSRAGVRGVNKAIRLRRGRNEKLVFAEISCSVDLDPIQRGVHMSRFPELFEQAIDELVLEEALLVEELAEHLASTVVARQHARRAVVGVTGG
jgi:GTP cyclohydrolase I/GTP cyclohydrolase-4